MPYSFCFALIDQATQQAFGVIPHVGSGVTKNCVGIVAVRTLAPLTSRGRKSRSQKLSVAECFHVLVGSPLSPWTATILDSRMDISHQRSIPGRNDAYSTVKGSGCAPSGFGFKISRPIISRGRSKDSTLANASDHAP